MKKRPFVAITMGDVAGIGPEVIAKALQHNQIYRSCRPFVIGNADAMEDALRIVDKTVPVRVLDSLDGVVGEPGEIDIMDPANLDYSQITYGRLSALAGAASVEWILQAGELASSGRIQAIVTGPINKEACNMAGYHEVGHMEIFQRQTNATEVATMLMARRLRVVHLTTHRSLRIACEYVTKENVLDKIKLTDKHFRLWGFPEPRIGVAALNPHSSDGGLLGDEEQQQIEPAVASARSLGINAIGPVPADTVFIQAIDGEYDVVLAMYHDQGHIPIKVHDWASSVSVNLGLPFIRTSVDHGTAYDIAGKGMADPVSMVEAIKTAVAVVSEGRLP